jgi:GrpB-like predicted nucleotidyltransferase (UPF0157 family)
MINIHLTVGDTADEASYLWQLNAAGYCLTQREPDWFEHRMLQAHDPGATLHVFSQGCPELERCRIFRDWLRISAEDRVLHAGLSGSWPPARGRVFKSTQRQRMTSWRRS